MNAQQLRNSILQQAIQGKLVPQDPSDEPASVLLQRIRKEKERLVKEGKLKKKDLESKPIEEDEIPFEIPESWEWCRIADISACELGKALDAVRNTGDYVDYLTGINVYWNRFDFSQMRKMRMTSVEYNKYHLEKGDLVVCEGGDAGRCAVWESDKTIAFQKALHRVRFYDRIHSSFYMYLMMIYQDTGVLEPYITGTTIKHLTNVQLRELILPLPPLAEQRRIVAKIEELMPLVERYGKAQQALDQLNESLPARLRQSILQEAIQGRLVPQDPKEEPASELLKRIRKEKEQLVKEGKLKKKDLESKPIEEDEIPFEIPESWEWVRLKDTVYNHGQKVPDKRFSYIDIGSIDNKRQRLNEKENIIEAKDAPSRARRIVKKDDIVYSTVRPYLHNVAIVDKEFSEEPIASTGFAVFSCFNGVYNKFLFYYLLSPEFDKYANDGDNAKGVAYPAINDEKLYKAIIPLPPLSEQKRIVAKVEDLFGVMKV